MQRKKNYVFRVLFLILLVICFFESVLLFDFFIEEEKNKKVDICKELFIKNNRDKKVSWEDLILILKEKSKEYEISENLLKAIIFVESRFTIKAKSQANAYGLMQIHFPSWKEYLDLSFDETHSNYIFCPERNIDLGCWILKGYNDKERSFGKAVLKYNGGNIAFRYQENFVVVKKESFEYLIKIFDFLLELQEESE